jgi:hypothetical protein
MTLLGLAVWVISLFVFLTGVPLLVNRDLSMREALWGVAFYTFISLGLLYGGWRALMAARKISRLDSNG